MTLGTALLMFLIAAGPTTGPEQVALEELYEINGLPEGTFGALLDIVVDEQGNLFVLDKGKRQIYEFDKLGAPKPIIDMRPADAEIWYPRAIFASRGRLYVLEGRNILIKDLDTGSISRLPVGGVFADTIFVKNGDIVVSGIKKGSEDSFHVLDDRGDEQGSFGGAFAVPEKILNILPKDYDSKLLSKPIKVYYSAPEEELFAANPFRYEIRIFRGRTLYKALTHDASYGGFAGGIRHSSPTGQNMGYAAGFIGFPSVIQRDGVILVFRSKSREVPSYCVDIFKDYEYRATQDLDIRGMPLASDREGNVYAIVESGGPASIIKMKLSIK